ncbi:MAG: peptide/nickel transport system permease protein, partial [Subtercola sp.]|nr:peptide/nickel transport system permease protein [Subtercola sp.]
LELGLPATPGQVDSAPAREKRALVLPAIGAVMLAAIALVVIVVPLLPGMDPLKQNLSMAGLGPFSEPGHILGTDALGRDTLARLALGGRTTLVLAVIVVAINLAIGLTAGLCAGYFGGVIDNVINFFSDVQLAMPVVLLLIAIAAVIGPNAIATVVVLGVSYWMGYARVARATAMSLRARDFTVSPMLQGASRLWVIRRHILPHVMPSILIVSIVDLGAIMMVQAGLDYLGLGIQPPTPTWGGMIFEGQKFLRTNPWQALVPGIAMFFFVAGTQFVSLRFTAETRAFTAVRRRRRATNKGRKR